LTPFEVDVIASAPGPVFSAFMDVAGMRTGMGVKPEIVARQTFAALGRKGTVRPGLISKLLEASLAPLPRWGRVRIMQLVMGGMTRHQLSRTGRQSAKS
jgi:short-subunit dehydrogenase